MKKATIDKVFNLGVRYCNSRNNVYITSKHNIHHEIMMHQDFVIQIKGYEFKIIKSRYDGADFKINMDLINNVIAHLIKGEKTNSFVIKRLEAIHRIIND